jgi:putative FmdB family regulatory protein
VLRPQREEFVPTYLYACTDCGDRSEVVQRFTDDSLSVCSACGGKLRKVFSPVGIVFKGSGFYRTDSRNGSSAVAAKDGAANGSGSTADGPSATSEAGKSAGSSSSSDASSSSSSGSGSSGSGEKKSSVAASAAS